MLRKLFAVLVVLVASLSGAIPVFAHDSGAGAVYVMTNAASGNQVVAYKRFDDGRLGFLGKFDTGGLGSGVGVTTPPDPLGSQNSLLLSPDGGWLFAVNAGSNDITVFKTNAKGLERTDKVSSGGDYPVSLAFRDGILYVLNAAGDGSINGFKVSGKGQLSHLKGSWQSLHAATPADGAQPNTSESPSQVGFTPDGHFLIVTDKGGVRNDGRILVFPLSSSGVPNASPEITATADPVPFAFDFDRYNHLVVAAAGMNTVTSYALDSDGSLHSLSSVGTTQKATCWIVTNGRYQFTDNPGSSSVSALQVSSKGKLTLLDGAAANTGAGTAPLDMGISSDGQYLYSMEVAAGKVGEYQVNSDGSLTFLDTIGGIPQLNGVQGIAVK